MSDKQYVLGLGAQRTGSTWLRSQLQRSPEVDLGFVKEYHFFDALFVPQMRAFHSPSSTTLLRERLPVAGYRLLSKSQKAPVLASFVAQPDTYFDYFENLWERNSRTRIVGDFTPSYSMLDRTGFSYARDQFDKRDFKVKAVFVMRDPVERIWSMMHQESKVRERLKRGEDLASRSYGLGSFTGPGAALRTRYDRTIEELEAVFCSGDIHYAFYEEYISNHRYALLMDFLGIESFPSPHIHKARNQSLMKSTLREELAAEVAEYYRPTYEYVEQKFGSQMRSLWAGYRYL